VPPQTVIEWPLYATDREIVDPRRDRTTPRTIVGAFPESQRTAGSNIAIPESHCFMRIVFHLGAWDGRATQLERAIDVTLTFGETEVDVRARARATGVEVPVTRQFVGAGLAAAGIGGGGATVRPGGGV